mmetsp:Transcript_10614/g.23717  ORF Transcript_10614/g.23717 Transcript_10614/m.23717 type:complete len:82 (+) Transcript_10614:589-834(+)
MVIETTGTEERRETREARFREKSFSSFSLSNASLDKLISGFILKELRGPAGNALAAALLHASDARCHLPSPLLDDLKPALS